MSSPACQYSVVFSENDLQVYRCGEVRRIFFRTSPKLAPGDTVHLKGCEILLSELSQALIHYEQEWIAQYLDERGQLDVGRYLYQQIFGTLSPYELDREGNGAEIRIVTQLMLRNGPNCSIL